MTLKQLWIKACEFDEIDPTAKFVVFSDENPWAARYNRAVGIVQRSKVAFEADKARRRSVAEETFYAERADGVI